MFTLMGRVLVALLGALLLSGPSAHSDTTIIKRSVTTMENLSHLETATFAGGCFWCTEADFAKHGRHCGGNFRLYRRAARPTPPMKRSVPAGPAITRRCRYRFDPGKISYNQLLDIYWRSVDPTDGEGQFADRGTQYRPAIFYHNAEQQKLAEACKSGPGRIGPFCQAHCRGHSAGPDFLPGGGLSPKVLPDLPVEV